MKEASLRFWGPTRGPSGSIRAAVRLNNAGRWPERRQATGGGHTGATDTHFYYLRFSQNSTQLTWEY